MKHTTDLQTPSRAASVLRTCLVVLMLGAAPAAFAVQDDTATTGFLESVVIDVLANDTLQTGDFIRSVSPTARGGFAQLLSRDDCLSAADIDRECIRYSPPSSDEQGMPFSGDDTFTYTVGNVDAEDRVATVTVTTLAEGPELQDDTATTVSEQPVTIDVRGNDTLMSGERLTFVSNPQSGGSVVILPPASCAGEIPTQGVACVRYQPPPTPTGGQPFSGTDTFTYTVEQAESSSTATVTVVVSLPEAPSERTLVADTAAAFVEQRIFIDVLANDTLLNGDVLLSATAGAAGGAVEVVTGGSCALQFPESDGQCLQYTPPPRTPEGVVFTGDDTFSYTVGSGGDAGGETDTAGVTVTVSPRDGTPRPLADDRSDVVAGESAVIDVLANDDDDGGVENLSIVSVTEPANGTAAINASEGEADTVTYTPNPGFVGTDSFFYTVSDGDSDSLDQAAQVTVTVSAATGENSLASLALTPEERELASAIDNVCAFLRGPDEGPVPPPAESPQPARSELLSEGQANLLERCTALIALANPGDGGDNTAAVRDALRQIAGEEVFAQSLISTQILNTQIKNIDSRLAALRGGARGVSVQGLALNVGGKALPGNLFSNAVEQSDNALLQDSRLGLFMNGRVNFGEQGATATENGFDFDTLGVTAGIDYRLRNDLAFGAAIGFANAEVDYNNTGGNLDSDSLTYTVYSTYFTDRFYIDVLAGIGDIDFDSARTMVFADGGTGVDTIALGRTEGDQRIVSANFGYNIDRNGWLFVPFLGYDFIDTNIDGYSEVEGQGWELAFDEQSVQSQILSAGVRMSYTKSVGFGVIVPHLRIALQEELEDEQRVLIARFVNDPTNTRFSFRTDAPDSSFLQLATGISVQMENGLAGFIDYETITGYDNLDTSTLTLGLRFERRFR
ncbi:MAG: autotransporter domain-containing protein [Pseudomonadota bacterium]